MSLAASLRLFNNPEAPPSIHLPSNTYDSNKNFSIPKTIKNTLTIICKGVQKNQRFEKCTFLCDESWGSEELVEHEKYHKSLEGKNYSWLGFDVPQSFGNFSGRDGKRA